MTTTSNRCPTRTRVYLTLIAAMVAGVTAARADSTARTTTSVTDAIVTVHAQHYRWADQSFDSLDALEATVLPRAPRSIALLACGSGAVPTLLAAAHRFRHLELHLGASEMGTARCVEEGPDKPALALRTVALREGAKPGGIDEVAVRVWWQQVMP